MKRGKPSILSLAVVSRDMLDVSDANEVTDDCAMVFLGCLSCAWSIFTLFDAPRVDSSGVPDAASGL